MVQAPRGNGLKHRTGEVLLWAPARQMAQAPGIILKLLQQGPRFRRLVKQPLDGLALARTQLAINVGG
jgi:hypothetical protein